ncbi:class I SAM-dependent methyltransferase [Streptomyces sp. NPDC048508]|uniref:class I SAM-dependent methyltransferase n=1 Tax=Streptomyces sp. NPDC048508 TaxID=3365561 RepID=UPI003710CD5B
MFETFDAAAYGEGISNIYDAPGYCLEDEEEAASFLYQTSVAVATDVANYESIYGCSVSALELGIGSGRVARPLAQKGVKVVGIDSSPAMLAKLPRDEMITGYLGDMTELQDLKEEFCIVFCVFNTLALVANQEDQIKVFQHAAKYLRPGGRFIIQLDVPDPAYMARSEWITVHNIKESGVEIGVCQHDPIGQVLDFQLMQLSDQGIKMSPARARYVWLSEIDLMARVAGMHLDSRAADWVGGQFGKSSQQHVSVYKKA